ncbi:F-BAR domain only protein 1 isoform X2 [Microcaecilia unicolor]|uniref:F-BAR domain only protein 1 isoform X2 n=1 Tax=Microcaecilia unicolor TaxID=1415580 RepID=A0A6P7ZB45_9AMPH|nr:F-BAR domain only protein 1 isoform X2 [Microcaecilia unicolor]
MSSFAENFWGDKNTGFGVLYQNMKQGHVSTKELADFVRERAAIEEAYSKSMAKLSKMASNSSQLGTFAPMWDVFRVSSDKFSLCHMELMKKLQDLIKEINRYGEEQLKVHKKCKEEASGTLEAMQALHSSSQVLHKAKENYYSKCLEYERLRKEGASQKELDKAELKAKKAGSVLGASAQKYNMVRAEFEQKMVESAQRFQTIEEVNLQHMKELMGSYVHSTEDTHVQIGQVQEEFKQNVENCSIADLIRRFIESKGTGRDKPGVLDPDTLPVPAAVEGVKRTRSKPFRIPGLSRKEKTSETLDCPDADSLSCREVDEEGFTLRLDVNRTEEPENHLCSSSDSDFDDEEPRRFRIQIKPVQSHHENTNPEAAVEQLRITVGNLILPPSSTASIKRHSSREPPPLPSVMGDVDSDALAGTESGKISVPPPATDIHSSSVQSRVAGLPSQALFGPPLESIFQTDDLTARGVYGLTSSPSPFSSSSPENVEDSGLDSPSHLTLGPSSDSRPWTPQSPVTSRLGKRPPSFSETHHGVRVLCRHTAKSGSPPASPSSTYGEGLSSAVSEANLEDSDAWSLIGGTLCGRFRDTTGPRGMCSRNTFFPAFSSPETVGISTSSSEGSSPWTARPQSPPTDQVLEISEQDTYLSSNPTSSCSPSTTPLCVETFIPSPWTQPSDPPQTTVRLSSVGSLMAMNTSEDGVSCSCPVISTTDPDVTEMAPRLHSCVKLPHSSQLVKNSEACCALNPSRLLSPSPFLPLPSTLTERAFLASPQLGTAAVLGLSRGPSPVVLGSQDALPVAAAFTEYIDAYFRGGDFESCLTRISGEMAMSFPAGIIRIFSSISPPPVLSFRLLNTAQVDQFIPNAALLYSDLSQSDPSTRDFWLNMQALSNHLQRQAEESPSASYYNVTLLKYQVSKPGPLAAPLKLMVSWKRTIVSTEVSVEYRYNGEAMANPTPLTNFQFLLPVEEPVASMELQPMASWNSEEKRLLWRLPDAYDRAPGGSGTLIASWEPLCGPTTPSPVAAQFISEGSTLSGIGVELVGSGYRMSLVKKRFATGKYLVGF